MRKATNKNWQRITAAAAFPEAKPPVTGAERQGSGLPYHSDEIARDSHPLPFYPPGWGRSPGGRHLLFSIQTR